ncbi:hypothetical protein, partial [Pseudomonas aeruginosa]|uniref:hypothetical protein n=1 Tax=Pseudomonas aeruginosa TaxID=287 RepID=UPI000F9A30D2
ATKGRQARPEVLSPFTTVRDFGVEPLLNAKRQVAQDLIEPEQVDGNRAQLAASLIGSCSREHNSIK